MYRIWKYITLSVPIKKELKYDKRTAYEIKFTDTFIFMLISLSSLADKLPEGLHNNKCKDYKPCLKHMKAKDNELIFNCLKSNKNSKKKTL